MIYTVKLQIGWKSTIKSSHYESSEYVFLQSFVWLIIYIFFY